jgi:prefoldin subunit 5
VGIRRYPSAPPFPPELGGCGRSKTDGRRSAVASQTLSAEDVLKREIERFDARAERARKELAEATEQADRLKRALAALSNGAPEQSHQD